jgi:hypothetical protein
VRRSIVVIGALLTAQAALSGAGAQAGGIPAPPPPGIYVVSNAASNGTCLAVIDPTVVGAKAAMLPCKPSLDQKWILSPVSQAPAGTFTIVNAASKQCLAVPGPGTGAPAFQVPCRMQPPEQWNLVPYAQSYQLRNVASKMNLVLAGSPVPIPVIQAPPSSSPAQIWIFR